MTILRDEALGPINDTNPLAIRTGYRAIVGSFIAAAAGNYDDNDVISDAASNGTGTPAAMVVEITLYVE